MVNIKGLNKATVLKTLFNNSKIQGFNAQIITMGLMEKPKDMTDDEAQSILDGMNDEKYFDYLNGKVMKVDPEVLDEFCNYASKYGTSISSWIEVKMKEFIEEEKELDEVRKQIRAKKTLSNLVSFLMQKKQ